MNLLTQERTGEQARHPMSEQQKVADLLTQYENAEQWLERTQPGTYEERVAMAASSSAYIELSGMGIQLYNQETYSYIGRQSLEQLRRKIENDRPV